MKSMNTQRGMSLVELLVSMVILAIIMVGVTKYIADQTRMMRQQEMLTNTQQNVRSAMDVIVRDLRSAQYDTINSTSTSPFRTFFTAAPTQVVFYTDINGNGVINQDTLQVNNEVKGFRWRAPDSIDISVPPSKGNWEAMAGDIQSLNFTYFNFLGDSVNVPLNQITSVRVRIVARTPRAWSTTGNIRPTRELQSLVQIRTRQGI
jgi:prepilin-type N-terminal cleavage/methylation domain-containing protein